MQFRADERGQAIQIGAVLLFAVLVIVFSLYQAFVVPGQNERVEFHHNVEIQEQLRDLRNAMLSAFDGSSVQSRTIQLGTNYPARLVARNPGPPSGRLQTVGTSDPDVLIAIDNATATGETGDLWNGSIRRYNTGGIVYVPDYNRYQNPPTTVYEHSVLYNAFDGATLTLANQSLISGNRISLVALNGSFSRSSSGSTTIDVDPISSSTRTILVSGNSSAPIKLNLTTRLSVSRWQTILSDEENVDSVSLGPNASAVADPFTRVQITLKPDVTYELQLAKVGVGTGTTRTNAKYLTTISGDETTITQGERQEIVLEVRDEYNNPVSGVIVHGRVAPSHDGTLDQTAGSTDAEGRVTFTYNSTGTTDPGTHEVQFSLDAVSGTFDGSSPKNVSTNVTVRRTSRGTGGSNLTYRINWTDVTTVPGLTVSSGDDCSAIPCNVSMQSTTTPAQPGAPVGFESSSPGVVQVLDRFAVTDLAGQANTTVAFQQTEGNATLWTVSGNTNDTRTVSIPGYENFENDFGRYGVFGTFEGDDPELSTENANSGSTSVVLHGGNDGGIVTQGYDTSGADMVIVEYWAQDNGVEAADADTGEDEDLVLEYLTASGTWQEADRVAAQGDAGSGNDPVYNRVVRVAGDALHSNFSVRFRQVAADDPGDEWLIDDPQIAVVGKRVAGGEPGGRTPGGGSGDTTLGVLVEDLSNFNENEGNYLLSYELSNPPNDFEAVTAHLVDNDNSYNNEWLVSQSPTGTLEYEDSNAGGNNYYIEVTAWASDGTAIDSWSVSDPSADGITPSGSDDLSSESSPTFTSYTIEDKSSNGQGIKYKVDFQATGTNFDRVETYLIAQNNFAGETKDTVTGTSPPGGYFISAPYGYDQNTARQTKVLLLLYDNRNVVVDRIVWVDGADGSGSTSG